MIDCVWLALAIGNSRLHWAWFDGSRLSFAWDTPHLMPEEIVLLVEKSFDYSSFREVLPSEIAAVLPQTLLAQPPELWLASVISEQVNLWATYPKARLVSLDQIPLDNLYPTLGIDRALAAWGAVQNWGAPVLVIDSGTALTLTGINKHHQLVGGAILPGFQLQVRSLALGTAALPVVTDLSTVTARWATNTSDAIRSGVLHTILAGLRSFIEAWWQEFPGSAIVLTGGDAAMLRSHLQQLYPHLAADLIVSPHLVLQGIQSIRGQIAPNL